MMTEDGRVASPNRLSSDDEARSGLHPSGFDPARLVDLADRCEQATGPSFEIDAAIAVEAAGYVLEKRGRDQKAWHYHETKRRRSASEYGGYDRLPRFTASLDAAMTLVPEGWWIQYLGQCIGGWRCRVETNGPFESIGVGLAGNPRSEPVAAPALALCAAALRARAAQGPSA